MSALDLALARARASIAPRVGACQLEDELAAGALVVDIRPVELRERDGELPGATVIDRNVLEWRLDPDGSHRISEMNDPGRRVVLVCDEGYASSLAAAGLRDLGLRNATDLVGGYQAWHELWTHQQPQSSRTTLDEAQMQPGQRPPDRQGRMTRAATKEEKEPIMAIQAGDKIPDVRLWKMTHEGPKAVTSTEALGEGKVVVFALPGAFTPTCSDYHLPGFVLRADELRAKGVETIACLSVNDPFVMGAWGRANNVEDQVLMLSDGNGEFTRAVDLEMDGSGVGLGRRSRRYAAILHDGVVDSIFVEEGPGLSVSSAESVLAAL